MTFATRHICLAVILGLLVGHVSVAIHAATHVSGDSADCELCFSYGDSSSGVAAIDEHELPENAGQGLLGLLDAPLNTQHVVSFRPRGPPSSA